MKYPRKKNTPPARVAEPVQVYLQPPDRERLARLTQRLGATKSDILRRGLEALEAQTSLRPGPNGEVRPPLPTYAGGVLASGVDLDSNAALRDLMDIDAETPDAAG